MSRSPCALVGQMLANIAKKVTVFELRPHQWQVFSEPVERDFGRRLIEFLAVDFPEMRQAPHRQMIGFVRQQIERARSYGLETERDLATYAAVAWVMGADFDTAYPYVQQVLQDIYPSDWKRRYLVRWSYESCAAMARAVGHGEALRVLPEDY